MKTARQLLEKFIVSSFGDPKRAAEMFSKDGAFEMPYLESIGFQWRYEGRESVEGFFKFVRDLYPDMHFHDLKVVCETAEVVVGESNLPRSRERRGERFTNCLSDGSLRKTVRSSCSANRSISSNSPSRSTLTNGLADYKVPGRTAERLQF